MGKKRKRDGANKRRKLVVEFDVAARKEYITGMSKRKKQRQLEAIEQLKKQVKEESNQAKKELKESMMEERAKKRALREAALAANESSEDEKEEEEEEDDTEKTKNVLRELSGGAESQVVTKHVDDEFTKKMFGSSTVSVTTTKLSTSLESNLPSTDEKLTFGQKNMKLGLTANAKRLQRLLDKQKRGGSTRRKSRKGKGKGKVIARERRDRR